jgi:hypothetical protein
MGSWQLSLHWSQREMSGPARCPACQVGRVPASIHLENSVRGQSAIGRRSSFDSLSGSVCTVAPEAGEVLFKESIYDPVNGSLWPSPFSRGV